MAKLINVLKNFANDENGASMVEYGLMVALVAAACVTAVTALGTAITGKFNSVAGSI
jgi:pilus assembly protein Flp/PilA